MSSNSNKEKVDSDAEWSALPSQEREQQDKEDEWGAFDTNNSNITSSKDIMEDMTLNDVWNDFDVQTATQPPTNNVNISEATNTTTASSDESWASFE